MIGGVDRKSAEGLLEKIEQNKDVCHSIKLFSKKTDKIITLPCTAAFLAAKAEILENYKVTTSRWLTSIFRTHYPDINLVEDAFIVEDKNIFSSGGITSYFDLALRVISSKVSPELSRYTASILVLEQGRLSQAPFVNQSLILKSNSDLGRRLETWLMENLQNHFSSQKMAEHFNMSQRSLLRYFQNEFGTSPREYASCLRIERAKMLLEVSLYSVDEISVRCGYSDVSSFRKRFSLLVGMGPSEYRSRFRSQTANP